MPPRIMGELFNWESDLIGNDNATVASQATNLTVTQTGRRKKRKRKSWVFTYFVESGVPKKWHCTVRSKTNNNFDQACGREYSKGTSTSTLALHLKNTHGIADSKLKLSNDMEKTIETEILPDEQRAAIFEEFIAWIVDDKQSFRVVENDRFRGFVNRLNHLYKLPSRRTLVRGIQDQFEQAEARFMNILSNIPGKVALTCDGWSSRTMKGYFAVTIHWICEKWVHRSAVLDFIRFPPPHNQWATAALLTSVIEDNEITQKIRAITTDSGAEMRPALKHLREYLESQYDLELEPDWHIRCVCHIINRAVIDSKKDMDVEVEKLRKMIKTVRLTPAMREEFKNIQVKLGWQTFKEVPSLDVENRWNSLFIMIDKSFVLRSVFQALSNTPRFMLSIETLADFEWDKLKTLKDFLEPAFEATTAASGSTYTTISMQPLIFEWLVGHCQDTIAKNPPINSVSPLVTEAAEAMLKKIKKYEPILNSSLGKLAVILDPTVPNVEEDNQNYRRRFLPK